MQNANHLAVFQDHFTMLHIHFLTVTSVRNIVSERAVSLLAYIMD